ETLRWVGPPPESTMFRPEDLAQLKASLPKALATDSNARAVVEKTGTLLVSALFGPGEPLLTVSFLHPDLATRRLSQRVGGAVMKALEEQFGDKMKLTERRELTRNLIAITSAQTKPSQP